MISPTDLWLCNSAGTSFPMAGDLDGTHPQAKEPLEGPQLVDVKLLVGPRNLEKNGRAVDTVCKLLGHKVGNGHANKILETEQNFVSVDLTVSVGLLTFLSTHPFQTGWEGQLQQNATDYNMQLLTYQITEPPLKEGTNDNWETQTKRALLLCCFSRKGREKQKHKKNNPKTSHKNNHPRLCLKYGKNPANNVKCGMQRND